jgi:hypothetical protein
VALMLERLSGANAAGLLFVENANDSADPDDGKLRNKVRFIAERWREGCRERAHRGDAARADVPRGT